MNASKIEFIMIGSRPQLNKCLTNSININGNNIKRESTIRYLGAFLDETLNFKDHINRKCRTAMMNYLRIKNIRQFLTIEATEVLVLSLVISHLDYCNVILFGVANCELRKMQRIQNMCAKLVLNRRKYDSPKQALFDLHWLPVKARIQFKILSFMYSCHNGIAPQYLTELLTEYVPSRQGLRSSDNSECRYVVPYNKCKTFNDRSFCTIGPKLWNELTLELRKCKSQDAFKKNLKTLYFREFMALF